MASKKSESGQLPLSLPVEERISRDDLVQGNSNQLAVDLLDSWPNWPSNMVLLAGPTGAGKSHIARVWESLTGATNISCADLKGDVLDVNIKNLVIEDLAPDTINEHELFFVINRIKANGGFLLMTSRSFPAAWQLEVPDLASRIRLAHLVELQEPDDQLLTAVLVKLFADRQLEINQSVVGFLVARMERSLEAAGKLVNWMDHEAMSRKSKINRQLAGEALTILDMN